MTRFKRAVAGQTKVLRPLFSDLTRKTMEQRCKFCFPCCVLIKLIQKTWSQWERCQKHVPRLRYNVFPLFVVGDLIYDGHAQFGTFSHKKELSFRKYSGIRVYDNWTEQRLVLREHKSLPLFKRARLAQTLSTPFSKKINPLPLRTTVSSVRMAPLKTRREPLSKSDQTSHSETLIHLGLSETTRPLSKHYCLKLCGVMRRVGNLPQKHV